MVPLGSDMPRPSHTLHKRTFSLTPSDLTGQINFALAVNDGAGLTRFATILKIVLNRKLQIFRGESSDEARRHRRHLLRLCVARGATLLQRRATLLLLRNGDWRRRDRVEVFVLPSATVDRDQIVSVVSNALVSVFCSTRMTVLMRSRWAGFDTSFDEVCLLDGIHGLMSTVLP